MRKRAVLVSCVNPRPGPCGGLSGLFRGAPSAPSAFWARCSHRRRRASARCRPFRSVVVVGCPVGQMDWPTEYDPSASDPLPTCNCAADHGGFQRSGYVRVGMRLACLACDRVSMCAFGIRIELSTCELSGTCMTSACYRVYINGSGRETTAHSLAACKPLSLAAGTSRVGVHVVLVRYSVFVGRSVPETVQRRDVSECVSESE